MEIINKKHIEIIANRRTNALAYINFVNLKTILFSTKASRFFGLEEGKFVHLINEENDWYFYVNYDPDGFALHKSSKNIRIFDAHLVGLFLRRNVKLKLPCKFLLQVTGAAKDGCPLIEIKTDMQLP